MRSIDCLLVSFADGSSGGRRFTCVYLSVFLHDADMVTKRDIQMFTMNSGREPIYVGVKRLKVGLCTLASAGFF